MKTPVEIFGILNITPDSFSDGGMFLTPKTAIERAQILFDNGATYVDVGGESTRPGAKAITPEEEWGRVGEVLEHLLETFPGEISLDSKNPYTVQKYLELGGMIINDVSGFQDPMMLELAAEFDALCIVNHFPGKTIEEVHRQSIDSETKVMDDLMFKAEKMILYGISPKNIVLDPGIGFGKTQELNEKLLGFAALVPDFKVLIGHSKKRFLGENRFESKPNIAAGKISADSGAWAIRVHDPEWYCGGEN